MKLSVLGLAHPDKPSRMTRDFLHAVSFLCGVSPGVEAQAPVLSILGVIISFFYKFLPFGLTPRIVARRARGQSFYWGQRNRDRDTVSGPKE